MGGLCVCMYALFRRYCSYSPSRLEKEMQLNPQEENKENGGPTVKVFKRSVLFRAMYKGRFIADHYVLCSYLKSSVRKKSQLCHTKQMLNNCQSLTCFLIEEKSCC